MEIAEFLKLGQQAEAEAERRRAEDEAIDAAMKASKKKTTPFEFIESIQTKQNIFTRKNAKHYNPFVVTMGLSQHVQNIGYAFEASILQANLAGLHTELANQMHFDYLFCTIRKGKQYGTWAKVDKYEHLDLIQNTYRVNRDEAISIIKRLTDDELQQLVDWDAKKSGGLVK